MQPVHGVKACSRSAVLPLAHPPDVSSRNRSGRCASKLIPARQGSLTLRPGCLPGLAGGPKRSCPWPQSIEDYVWLVSSLLDLSRNDGVIRTVKKSGIDINVHGTITIIPNKALAKSLPRSNFSSLSAI